MTDGYHVYIAMTDDKTIDASAYYRFNMVLHDVTLVYTDKKAPRGFVIGTEEIIDRLPNECRLWIVECIDKLIVEYANNNLKEIEKNDREFMIAFEKQLEFERQRTEEIADERNQ